MSNKAGLEVVKKWLDKLGANYSPKISEGRAVSKLLRYMDQKGLPEGMTAEEKNQLDKIILMYKDADKPEQAEKKAPKPKAAKDPRPDWMTIATQAVMASAVPSCTLKQAAKKAVSLYRAAGGRITELSDKWGVLYTSYAVKVLVAVNKVREEDGKIFAK